LVCCRRYAIEDAVLHFRDIDPLNPDDVQCLVRWSNDDSIRHLAQRFACKEQFLRRLKVPHATKMLREAVSEGKCIQLIERHGIAIGEVSLEMDPKHLVSPDPGTAWIGIVLGERLGRGRGVGRQAMLHMEALAAQRGALRVQIGVFEFNTRARRLYESLGYREIARLTEFTWWQDKMWSDIRLSKTLRVPPQ